MQLSHSAFPTSSRADLFWQARAREPPVAPAAAAMAEAQAEPGAKAKGPPPFDPRFEFDAPRFYDFEEGSPEGSRGSAGDKWFNTSATKGLATPPDNRAAAAQAAKQQQQQQGGAGKDPTEDKPLQQGQPAGGKAKARKVLGQITNDPASQPGPKGAVAAPEQQQQQAAQPKPGPPPAKATQAPMTANEAAAPRQPAKKRTAEEAGGPAAPGAARDTSQPGQTQAVGPSAEPVSGTLVEVEGQAAKRQRMHGMATRSMSPGRSTQADSKHAGAKQAGEPSNEAKPVASTQNSKLTVPKSPTLGTKMRTRPTRFKPREVVEEEEMAAMPKFKARPLQKHILLDKSGRLGVPSLHTKPPTDPEPFQLATDQRAVVHQGASAAAAAAAGAADGVFVFKAQAEGARMTRSRKKAGGITEPKPFLLATHARGEVRQAQRPASAASQGEQRPKSGKRRRVEGAPQLLTDARGERAQAQLEQQRQAELQQLKQAAEFKALPMPKGTLQHPFQPAPSTAPLTIPDKVVLASDARAKDRMEFDHALALKQQLEVEERAAEEERRRKEQEKELKKYRKGLQFKAKPLPAHIYGGHDELS